MLFLQIAFENINHYNNVRICLRTRTTFFKNILDRLVRAPVNIYHDVTPIGRILGFFSEDIPAIDWYFFHCIQSLFRVNAMMCILTLKTILALPIMTPVCIYNWFVGKYLKDQRQKVDEQWGKNFRAAQEKFTVHTKLSFSGRAVVNIY